MRKITFENGKYYHVYNRGVEKRNIFRDDKDRFRFIHDLYEFNDKNNVLNNQYYFGSNYGVSTSIVVPSTSIIVPPPPSLVSPKISRISNYGVSTSIVDSIIVEPQTPAFCRGLLFFK